MAENTDEDQELSADLIPWPSGPEPDPFSVGVNDSSVLASATLRTATRDLLKAALRRWHPDKAGRFISKLPEGDRKAVEDRIKALAQKCTASMEDLDKLAT